jgi:uncharacterized protein (TIGR02266 family)
MGGESAEFDVQQGLAEFAELNRRRLFGSPPLGVAELERWVELRGLLERHFSARRDPGGGEERRAYFRIPTHLRVEFRSDQELRSAFLRNLSEGGLFIATDRPLEPGAKLALAIHPPSGESPVELDGVVAWVRTPPAAGSGEAVPPGMGIRFERLSAEQARGLARLMRRVVGALA